MIRQIPHTYSICTGKVGTPCYCSADGRTRVPCNREAGERCYRSADGRFRIRNTWSAEKVREPNWLLVDLVTGLSYRFFVRMQLEQKMQALLVQTGGADAGSP